MEATRKEFLEILGKGTLGAVAASTLDVVMPERSFAADVLESAEVRKIHQYITSHKEEHIRAVQADLRQPSVSAQNIGIREMADRMVESFRKLGCKEVDLVKTDGHPGVWAYYDAGAPKTVVVYFMYDTTPYDEKDWSSPPLEAQRVKKPPFEEVIVARGASNDKGPNRFYLNALESIKAVTGTLPLNFMFTCDGEEEIASPHFHQVLDPYRERMKRANAMLKYWTTGSPQDVNGQVEMYLGYKGILYLELETKSRGGTLSFGHNPVWRLMEALRSIYDPAQKKILIPGYYDDVRPPNAEEIELMNALARMRPERLRREGGVDTTVIEPAWTVEEAAHHRTFDSSININGIYAGYTGEGHNTRLPLKATAKIDFRTVPNQSLKRVLELVRAHMRAEGFDDVQMRPLGPGTEWSQTSVNAPVSQAMLSVYKHYGMEPIVWPRMHAASPEFEYTRNLGLPACNGGLGHGLQAHAANEYIVVEGNEKVAGIVRAEQSIVDMIYAYANWPEPTRRA